ncbi:hypothetical protein [Kordia sp.]|uniref:hypothetical protein n=1 Tax=Kordia sp. TaxID=1965332 RepID=UPI003D2ACE16
MKKRNFKSLELKKSSISKLNGGGIVNPGVDVHFNTTNDTVTIIPYHTQGAERGCIWYSELYTACECHSLAGLSNCADCPVDYNHDTDAHGAM